MATGSDPDALKQDWANSISRGLCTPGVIFRSRVQFLQKSCSIAEVVCNSVWQETERWTRTTSPLRRASVSGERGVVERILSCCVAERRRRGDHSLADASLDRRHQNAYKSMHKGGVISPLLANIALHGMEEVARRAGGPEFPCVNGKQIHQRTTCIRYADDFVILHRTWELDDQVFCP